MLRLASLVVEAPVLLDLRLSLLATERNIIFGDWSWKIGRRSGRQALTIASEDSMFTQIVVGAM